MSDTDISLLTRLVETYYMLDQEFAAQALPVLEAAAADEHPEILSDAEAASLANAIRAQNTAFRDQHHILTSNREALVGTLLAAQNRIREAGATDASVALLAQAAGHDSATDDLSGTEVELLFAHLEQELNGLTDPTAEAIHTEVGNLMEALGHMRDEAPVAFVPTDREEQRATINLNFLKNIPESAFTGDPEDPQVQMLQQLIVFGGIDLNDRDAEWDLSWEDMGSAYENIPEEHRGEMPPREVMMANMRFLAYMMEEALNARMGEMAAATAEGSGGDAITLEPILAQAAVAAGDPFLDLLIENAGDDGVFTRVEAGRMAERIRARDGIEIDVDAILVSARRYVEDYAARLSASIASAAPELRYTRYQHTSIEALNALDHMRSGFTRTDVNHIEDSSASFITNAASWIVTMGGLLTCWVPLLWDTGEYQEGDWAAGPTLRALMRYSATENDRERGAALDALRALVTEPSEEFRHYLEENAARLQRENGNSEPSIPNALDYLAHHEDPTDSERNLGYHEILTGPTFQADRIWRIYRHQEEGERDAAIEEWEQLVQDMRDGVWSSDTYLDHISNATFAREILGFLISKSGAEETDVERWRLTLDDSLGNVMMDSACLNALESEGITAASEDYADRASACTLYEPRGESLWYPGNWFDWGGFVDGNFALNWSDEQSDEVVGDVASMLISWRVAGWVFRGLGWGATTGANAVARTPVATRALAALGVEYTGENILAALVRAFAPEALLPTTWAARWVANAETRVATATTVAARLRAERALSSAESFQAIVNGEASIGSALAERARGAAPRLTGWMGRVVRAHPPMWRGLRTALRPATRGGTRSAVAWGTAHALRQISLAGAGRGLRYVGYEGILLLALVRQSYEHLRGEEANRLVYDREIELGLPGPGTEPAREPTEEVAEDSDSAPDSPRPRPAGPTRLGAGGHGGTAPGDVIVIPGLTGEAEPEEDSEPRTERR